jgi:hypothetical protein
MDLRTTALDNHLGRGGYITANPDKAWSYYALSQNPNITWDIVVANPGITWNCHYLSMNASITWDIVAANQDKDWNYWFISKNPVSKHPFFQRQLSFVLK